MCAIYFDQLIFFLNVLTKYIPILLLPVNFVLRAQRDLSCASNLLGLNNIATLGIIIIALFVPREALLTFPVKQMCDDESVTRWHLTSFSATPSDGREGPTAISRGPRRGASSLRECDIFGEDKARGGLVYFAE